MDLLSSAQATTPSPATNIDPMDTTHLTVSADNDPLSPPASPTFVAPKFPLRDAKVSNYKKPSKTPRFPRHPCPTANYNLSLLSAEHQAQRLFGQSFALRNPKTGELLGPFAVLSYTDGWISRYCNYIHSILSSSIFTLRERELIVLAVASVTRAEYIMHAHRRIAASVGLDDETIEGALVRYSWMDMMNLSPREKNVYRIASEMAENWGCVSDETWAAVVVKDKPKAKGQEGWLEREFIDVGAEIVEACGERLQRGEVATLAQMLAGTMFVSVLVNCADLDLGVEEEEVVRQP
ncbi:hypothetical protein N0V86_009339 [Didymella sp. IMI 355093]|nr:hypothetical protein N0V86_009339 [Didymella sp. IMI 355093]